MTQFSSRDLLQVNKVQRGKCGYKPNFNAFAKQGSQLLFSHHVEVLLRSNLQSSFQLEILFSLVITLCYNRTLQIIFTVNMFLEQIPARILACSLHRCFIKLLVGRISMLSFVSSMCSLMAKFNRQCHDS